MDRPDDLVESIKRVLNEPAFNYALWRLEQTITDTWKCSQSTDEREQQFLKLHALKDIKAQLESLKHGK